MFCLEGRLAVCDDTRRVRVAEIRKIKTKIRFTNVGKFENAVTFVKERSLCAETTKT